MPSQDLAFSVALFLFTSVFAVLTLVLRRFVSSPLINWLIVLRRRIRRNDLRLETLLFYILDILMVLLPPYVYFKELSVVNFMNKLSHKLFFKNSLASMAHPKTLWRIPL